MRRPLRVLDESVLDEVQVKTPCTADWERMHGGDQSRFCGHCRKHVYDLSAMSRSEAVALIRRREGAACIRLRRRPDGRMVNADCRDRLRAARQRGMLPFVVALVFVGLAHLGISLLGLRATWSWLSERRDAIGTEEHLMGVMKIEHEAPGGRLSLPESTTSEIRVRVPGPEDVQVVMGVMGGR